MRMVFHVRIAHHRIACCLPHALSSDIVSRPCIPAASSRAIVGRRWPEPCGPDTTTKSDAPSVCGFSHDLDVPAQSLRAREDAG